MRRRWNRGRPARAVVLAIAALVASTLVASTFVASTAWAHEGDRAKKLPKSKAAADIKLARKKLAAAKKKLAAAGRYSCCVAPGCDLCLRVNGSCECAANLAAGKGACGECVGGWKAGRGDLGGVSARDVAMLPSCHQAAASCHPADAPACEGASPCHTTAPPELGEAREALDRAKKILVSEGRFTCCAKGGCDQCALEGICECGKDLVADLSAAPGAKRKGVCGDCYDAWGRGAGLFRGVTAGEVALAEMATPGMLTPAGGLYRTQRAVASGTSLLPASSSMHAYHFTAGDWLGMLHGLVRAGFNRQYGKVGVGKLESQNWLMAMAEREAGPGRLALRGMLSAEPLTAPHGGFPQLFQTGETYRGKPIYNAQHPHDLFMELAAMYTVPLGEQSAVQFYGAAVGEPAIGPPAFMHRPSAAENPNAPLGHHGQDSSHITHGVFTVGLQARRFKVEASAFHGREPDERRAGIELGAIDSWSARLWFTPSRDWTMQVSGGRVNRPEALSESDKTRLTASIHHNHAWEGGVVASSLIWGRESEALGDFNSYLLESTVTLAERNHLYGRAELADKYGLLPQQYAPAVIEFRRPRGSGAAKRHSPVFDDGGPSPDGFIPIPTRGHFRVGAFTLGYVRDVYDDGRFAVGVGADVTVHTRPGVLDARYGEHPIGSHVFIRIRPSASGM
jgi:hypothetical protein